MRRLQLSRFFWLACLALLLIYGWTLTERVTVTVRVEDNRCTASLYGRSSAIDCPGLTNGTLLTYVERNSDRRFLNVAGAPGRFALPTAWGRLEPSSADEVLPATGPLPRQFELHSRLSRPYSPAGLVLQRPGETSGWAFVVDGALRRGVWWTWQDGAQGQPLQGVPLDRPFLAQAQAFTRQALRGWWGAIMLVVMALALDALGRRTTNRHTSAAWFITSFRLVAMRSKGFLLLLRRLLVLFPILFAFAVALHVSVHVLERTPHVQDSVTYLFQAQTLARGRLAAPAPPLAEAGATPHFAQEFLLVRHGRWFGKYSPGYPALLALGVRAGAHWLVNPLLAALTVALTRPLAKKLMHDRRPLTADRGKRDDRRRRSAAGGKRADSRQSTNDQLNTDPLYTALLPPLFLALSPFFLILSGSLMAHIAELWWAMLFMVAWARAWRRGAGGGRRRWAVVAGVAFGLLFLTRPFTAVFIGCAYGLPLPVLLWLAARNPNPLLTSSKGRRTSTSSHQHSFSPLLPFSPAPLLLFAALAAIPLILALLAYQAAVTGDPLTDPRRLYWPYDRVGFGPDMGEPQNAFVFAPTAGGPAIQWITDPDQPPRGHNPARGLYNLGINLDALGSALFGWPALFSLSFVWLAFLLRRPRAVDWLMLLLIAAVAAGHVAYWASGVAYGPRYLFAALPVLVILTSRGIGALAVVAGRRATAAIVIGLLAFNVATLPSRVAAYRDYNFVDPGVRAAIEEKIDTPALVFVTASATDWWEYGVFFSGNTPWLDGDVVYARDLGAAENQRLRDALPGRTAYLWQGELVLIDD